MDKDALIKELLSEIARLKELTVQLLEQNRLLTEKVAELERRLNKNSQNSSKPPSSDGPAKKPTKSLRKKGKNPKGGQKGHPGKTLE